MTIHTPEAFPLKPRVFLMSLPRSACHLLEKMLSQQPDTAYDCQHHFLTVFDPTCALIDSGPVDTWQESRVLELQKIHRTAYEAMIEFLKKSDEQNTKAFYHEHPMFLVNPAFLSSVVYPSVPKVSLSDWVIRPSPSDQSVVDRVTIPEGHKKLNPDVKNGSSSDEVGNPTVMPSSLWLDKRNHFIFSIRHPLLQVVSLYRALFTTSVFKCGNDEAVRLYNQLWTWNRALYDYLTSHGMPCYVIDADEYTIDDNHDKSLALVSPQLRLICEKVGFSADDVATEWEPMPEDQRKMIDWKLQIMLKNLHESDGPKKFHRPGRELDIEHEREKWKTEFGAEAAGHVEELVERVMGDYEYLWQKRVDIK